MNTWFETKVTYEKFGDKGLLTKVSEIYLINAMSFTEAEARITKELEPQISGDFEVAGIKKTKINEFVEKEEGDKWYKAKVMFIQLDDNGNEKLLPSFFMIKAFNLTEAVKYLSNSIESTMGDYKIVSVLETLIMDVYDYQIAVVIDRKPNLMDE
ncbi:MAG: DUF4494 domain-containing protein [Prevotellaceae bacterium]|jgi:hypothetical protein|nr:DUF4494 domain-containing protein [Prevotellaceae bacterium]